ncbi:hypothetical protein [Mucilaginibacter sp. HD30]
MKRYIFFFSMFFIACRSDSGSNKTISIFFEPTANINERDRHVFIYLNGKIMADKIIKANLPAGFANVVSCFEANTEYENEILLKVNSKVRIIDLNRYKTNCLSVHFFYDDMSIIRRMARRADSTAISHGKTLNKFFLDSMIAHTAANKLDTLWYSVDEEKCPCGSASK